MKKPRVIIVTGPTATGKSRTALAVARSLVEQGMLSQIISADSVQVYRYMDIGTDKLPAELRGEVPHHLIDVALPDQSFSAAEFSRSAHQIINETWQRGQAPVVAGGTGFYLRALLKGLFPGPGANEEVRARLYQEAEKEGVENLHERLSGIDAKAAQNIHPRDLVRIIRALEVYELTGEPISDHFHRHQKKDERYHVLMIGLCMDREKMYQRINDRVHEMMEQGLVDEVKGLREMGYGPDLKSQQALGYKQVHMMLDGLVDIDRAAYLIKRDTRHYARRQLTWFRKEDRLTWIPAEDIERIKERAVRFMEDGSSRE